MKITAQDLLRLQLIDHIVPEPVGGAHRDHMTAAKAVGEAISRVIGELERLPLDQLLDYRYKKYRNIGFYLE
jgi:acetyl-CoA carboxylase carboxyl transferase subunit alpha